MTNVPSKPGGLATSAPLMGRDEEPTVFELSVEGRTSATFRTTDVPQWSAEELIPGGVSERSQALELASVSERDLTAHFTRLSHRQYSVDLGAYPLGSCTMKYNPKLCDEVAALPGFGHVHPSAPESAVQGWLELFTRLGDDLCAITGMAAVTLQPPAGAAGELTGLLDHAGVSRGARSSANQNNHSRFGSRYKSGVGDIGRIRNGDDQKR